MLWHDLGFPLTQVRTGMWCDWHFLPHTWPLVTGGWHLHQPSPQGAQSSLPMELTARWHCWQMTHLQPHKMASIFSSLKSHRLPPPPPAFFDNFAPTVHYVKNHTYYARVGLAQLDFTFHLRCWHAAMTCLAWCSCRRVASTEGTMKPTVPPTLQPLPVLLAPFDCGIPPGAKPPKSETKVLI